MDPLATRHVAFKEVFMAANEIPMAASGAKLFNRRPEDAPFLDILQGSNRAIQIFGWYVPCDGAIKDGVEGGDRFDRR